MPGISTSLIPAPGEPAMTLLAPAIVTRSHLVGPAAAPSGCTEPSGSMVVVTLPAAVLTWSWLATGRLDPSLSSWTPMRAGIRTVRLKLIWIHWPTGVFGLPSVHDVAGFPSKALTGSNCGSAVSQEPYDEAVTAAAA